MLTSSLVVTIVNYSLYGNRFKESVLPSLRDELLFDINDENNLLLLVLCLQVFKITFSVAQSVHVLR